MGTLCAQVYTEAEDQAPQMLKGSLGRIPIETVEVQGASDDCLYGSNIEGSMALSYSNDAKVMFCPARFFEIHIDTPVITTEKVGHNFVLCRCPPPLFTRHVLVDRPKIRHHSSSWLLSV